MLKFECKNLGTDCTYVVTGETVDDLKKNAQKHAQTVHKDMLAKMTPKQVDEMFQTVVHMAH